MIVNANIEGFEATMRAFRKMEDGIKKERGIRRAQSAAGRIFQRAVKSTAIGALDDTGELAESFKNKRFKASKSGRSWIDTRFGPKGGDRKLTYAGKAAIFNTGTSPRYTKAGKHTGSIGATRFIDEAFNKVDSAMDQEYQRRLKMFIYKAVHGAGWRGELRKG